MKAEPETVKALHQSYIKDTRPEDIVEIKHVLIAVLPPTLIKGAAFSTDKVY